MALATIFRDIASLKDRIREFRRVILFPEQFTSSDFLNGLLEQGRFIPFVVLSCTTKESLGTTIRVSNKPLETGDVFPEHFHRDPLEISFDSYVSNYVLLESARLFEYMSDILQGGSVLSGLQLTSNVLRTVTNYRETAVQLIANWQKQGRFIRAFFLSHDAFSLYDGIEPHFYISDFNSFAGKDTGNTAYQISLTLTEAPLVTDTIFAIDIDNFVDTNKTSEVATWSERTA